MKRAAFLLMALTIAAALLISSSVPHLNELQVVTADKPGGTTLRIVSRPGMETVLRPAYLYRVIAEGLERLNAYPQSYIFKAITGILKLRLSAAPYNS